MLGINLFGCRIEIKFTFFALLAFCGIFAGFSGGAFLFAAVLLHELSHLFALALFHAPPEKLIVSALGCRLVKRSQNRLTYLQNAVVSLAGPVSNIILFAASALLGAADSSFAMSCLALGIFHSLPIEPLDGGLALHCLLCNFFSRETAAKITLAASLLFLTPLAVLGFMVLLRTRYNFSLLAVSAYLIAYIVLKREDFAE